MVTLNLDSMVGAKLSRDGKDFYRERIGERPYVNEKGLTSMRLWDFALIFGKLSKRKLMSFIEDFELTISAKDLMVETNPPTLQTIAKLRQNNSAGRDYEAKLNLNAVVSAKLSRDGKDFYQIRSKTGERPYVDKQGLTPIKLYNFAWMFGKLAKGHLEGLVENFELVVDINNLQVQMDKPTLEMRQGMTYDNEPDWDMYKQEPDAKGPIR